MTRGELGQLADRPGCRERPCAGGRPRRGAAVGSGSGWGDQGSKPHQLRDLAWLRAHWFELQFSHLKSGITTFLPQSCGVDEIKTSPRQSLLEAGSAHPRQRLRFNRRGSRRVSLGPHVLAAIPVLGAGPGNTAPRPLPSGQSKSGWRPCSLPGVGI